MTDRIEFQAIQSNEQVAILFNKRYKSFKTPNNDVFVCCVSRSCYACTKTLSGNLCNIRVVECKLNYGRASNLRGMLARFILDTCVERHGNNFPAALARISFCEDQRPLYRCWLLSFWGDLSGFTKGKVGVEGYPTM